MHRPFLSLTILWVVVAPSVFAATAAEKATPGATAQPIDPIDVRFAPGSQSVADAEIPDFQKHVVPLLGRLGCNGRACHGSFQGRGGFQLSLFGYDFDADHAALTDADTGRVDVADPDESLMLAKPTDADMHEGGKRFDVGSWQHRVLRRWISAGAAARSTPAKLTRLIIEPSTITFDNAGQTVPLSVTAQWSDGTAEDVRPLSRFASNDEAIATIDESGVVTAGDRGDTHLVVSYDNAVVPIPVLRPYGDGQLSAQELADGMAPSPSDHPIDRLINAQLKQLGIVPSPLASDSDFIRRVTLDVTGLLPTADRVVRFLDDSSPDKRVALVEELLRAPGYASWWATRLSDWTGNNDEQLNNALPIRGAATKLWYQWLRERLDRNMPYDQIVAGIVDASNRQPGEDYLQYCQAMAAATEPGGEAEYAGRDGMPLFWARQNFVKPEDRAIGFAYSFLGIRIECAQCHKHPFDQWSKSDFEEFAMLFAGIQSRPNTVAPDAEAVRDELLEELTDGKKLKGNNLRKLIYEAARKGEIVPFPELVYDGSRYRRQYRQQVQQAKRKGGSVDDVEPPSARVLGQETLISLDEDPRPALVRWMVDPENPYFARAIVNRVWANYFGRGIVDPSDDMNLANPPVNAPLLDHLSDSLIENGFDLKWLHRHITTSDAYARSTRTNSTNAADRSHFSHHLPRRLPAEVVHDAVLMATGSPEIAAQSDREIDGVATAGNMTTRRGGRTEFSLTIFGQSIRESNCDCDRSDDPSLLQSIYLRNDTDIYRRLSTRGAWVDQISDEMGWSDRSDKSATLDEPQIEQIRRQAVSRVAKLEKVAPKRRKVVMERFAEQHAKLIERLELAGYTAPGFDDLMRDPEQWIPKRVSDSQSRRTASRASIDDVIERAYLQTLSRRPEDVELQIARSFLQESGDPTDGLESLMWTLVNTKEFILTH